MKTYFQLREELEGLQELSKKTMKSYRKKVSDRLGQHASGEYHPMNNPVKTGWELDQYQDKARIHRKMDKVAKKKIDAIKAKKKAGQSGSQVNK